MSLRSIFSCLILTAGFATCATTVHAENLKISNSSKYTLSFKINDRCSKVFGPVNDHAIKIVPQKTLKKVCKDNPKKCEIKVYKNAECKGEQLSLILLDLNSGLQMVKSNPAKTNDVTTGISIFNVFFSGPWN